MSKHTPGPWEYNQHAGEVVVRDKSIANIWNYSNECTDNGFLIAAAPDLLESAKKALAELIDLEEALDQNSPTLVRKELMRAINKAEGKE